jgi:predicted dienelactone hydrolase
MKKCKIVLGFFIVVMVLCFSVSSVGALAVPPPDQPGPFHVGWFKVWYWVSPYGLYRAMIRYPASRDGWRAPLNTSQAPYPGIVVANGFAGSERSITWIPKHLASYGYVTLCFTPPHKISGDATQWASGFRGGFEALRRQNSSRFSPIFGAFDNETRGAIGLSMGGGGCVEATGIPGSFIDAAVALAPAGLPSVLSAARNITVPIQLQVGTVDGFVPPASVLRMYSDYLSNNTVKEYLLITGGNHIGFIDEFYAHWAQQHGLDNPPGIPVEQQHNISRRYFTAWFQYYLNHLTDYYTYLFGENAQQDLTSGVLTDLRYNIP